MYVTIKTKDESGSEVSQRLRTVRVGDWSYRQADEVRALTTSRRHPEGLGPGDIFALVVKGDEKAGLAFAIVAYMVAGRDPSGLPDFAIDAIEVDLTDDVEADADPPAEGVAAVETSDAK